MIKRLNDYNETIIMERRALIEREGERRERVSHEYAS